MDKPTTHAGTVLAGLGLGAVMGLLEAAWTWSGAPVDPWVWPAAVALNGVTGGLVASLLAMTGVRLPALPGLTVLTVAVCIAGLFPAFSESLPVPMEATASADERTNVLWVTIEGVEADVAYGEDVMTSLAPLKERLFSAEVVRAMDDDPDVAWASLLTGRARPGHGVLPGVTLDPSVPTIGDLAKARGYAAVSVSHEGTMGLTGFGHRVKVRTPRLAGVSRSVGSLTVFRLMDSLLGPEEGARVGADASTVVDQALASIGEASGLPLFMMVNLRDPWIADGLAAPDARRAARVEAMGVVNREVGRLLDGWREQMGDDGLLVISGVGGVVPRQEDPALWGTERSVPLWIVWPASFITGQTVSPQMIRTVDVVPSLATVLDSDYGDRLSDGEDMMLRWTSKAMEAATSPPLGFADGDPCDGPHRRLEQLMSFETQWRGGEAMADGVMSEGYLLLGAEEGKPRRLFSVVEDPTLAGVGVRDAAVTCRGATGRERREAFLSARAVAEAASGALRDNGLEGWRTPSSRDEDLPLHSRYR
jgi:hypothetical protein